MNRLRIELKNCMGEIMKLLTAFLLTTLGAGCSLDKNDDLLLPADLKAISIFSLVQSITVAPESGLVTTEAGGTAIFTVVLKDPPSADVTIALSSSNSAEGTVSPASLVFTQDNYSTAQIVTVTGVDDTTVDGDIGYSIITAAAVSSDREYNGMDIPDVSVTNTDDETSGINVSATAVSVTEGALDGSYTITLAAPAAESVTVSMSALNGQINSSSVTFAAGVTTQIMVVSAVDDSSLEGTHTDTLTHNVTSAGDYNGALIPNITATITDNEVAAITVTSATVTEGSTATYTITLSHAITQDVTISLASSDTTLTVPASVTIAAGSTTGTVTVTAVEDSIVEGTLSYNISHIVTSAGLYNGETVPAAAITALDNDTGSVSVAPTDITVNEGGSSGTYTVTLSNQATASVTVSMSSVNGQISPASVTFAPGVISQSMIVAAVNDTNQEGIHTDTLIHTVTSAGVYNGAAVSNVAVTIIDDDFVAPTGFIITTGTQNSISMSWGAVTGATSYRVFRDTSAAFTTPVEVYNGGTTSIIDTGLASGQYYYYAVQAENLPAVTVLSSVARGTTLDVNNFPPDLVVAINPVPALTVPELPAPDYFLKTSASWSAGGYTYYLFDRTFNNASTFAIGAYDTQGTLVNSWFYSDRYITSVTFSGTDIIIVGQSKTTTVPWGFIYPP